MSSNLKPNKLRSLLITQFFGAFNDNAWKLMVTFLGIEAARLSFSGDAKDFEAVAQFKTSVAFSALTIPLVLFSLPGGWLADRYSKRSVIIALKYAELLILSAAAVSVALCPHNFFLLVTILILLGIHSSLFSPSKYGILPELVSHDRLTYANSQLELWSFLAIIFGTASGGIFLSLSAFRPELRGVPLILFGIIGLISSYLIPKVPAANASMHWKEGVSNGWSIIKEAPVLIFAIAGSVYFWALASLLGQNIVVYSKAVLLLTDAKSALPLAACGLGVGLGSLVIPSLSKHQIRLGLVPIGALALSVCVFLIAFTQPKFLGVMILMSATGIASAFIAIPLQSVLQSKSPPKFRGAVLSIANVFIFSGTFAGTFLTGLFGSCGISTQDIFYISAGFTLVAGLATLLLLRRPSLR